MVDAAEKEASEVLHSLLSVERVDKSQTEWPTLDLYTAATGSHSQSLITFDGSAWDQPPVHTIFSNLPTESAQPALPDIAKPGVSGEQIQQEETAPKKPIKKKKKKPPEESNYNPNKLEENADQVREHFERGCECQEENCYKNLKPEFVYRHRLNIAELTKSEHDMYLMGVTMACLANPEETVRHKERKRLRARYVFQGKEVCLDAFLYLENCTHYQLKRIRKHVMTHGVTPRIHGNHGKKPHNMFSLDIYQLATSFLQRYVKDKCGISVSTPGGGQQTGNKGSNKGKAVPVWLPPDLTRKKIHSSYLTYCDTFKPTVKVMGYSTFRHFMKVQFPYIKFSKPEPSAPAQSKTTPQKTSRNTTMLDPPQLETTATVVPVVVADPLEEELSYVQETGFVFANSVSAQNPVGNTITYSFTTL